MEYHVMWEIDIEGDDPVDAALRALACLRKRGTTAVVFDVTAEDGETIRVDLMNEERYLKP
jgi:acetolactate synthase regulatory subunit